MPIRCSSPPELLAKPASNFGVSNCDSFRCPEKEKKKKPKLEEHSSSLQYGHAICVNVYMEL